MRYRWQKGIHYSVENEKNKRLHLDTVYFNIINPPMLGNVRLALCNEKTYLALSTNGVISTVQSIDRR